MFVNYLYLYIYIYICDIHKCTNKFDIINYADDTRLISTINKVVENYSTGINNNVNLELSNIYNSLLAQRLTSNFNVLIQNVLCFTCHKMVPSLKLSICNFKNEEVDHFNF